MSFSQNTTVNITAMVLDKEGRLLHLAIPQSSGLDQEHLTPLGHPKESVYGFSETHAFIARACTFKGDPDCQLFLMHPRKQNGESAHNMLALLSSTRLAAWLGETYIHESTGTRYLYSGECHVAEGITLADLRQMAEEEVTLSRVYFMLKGTETTTHYRDPQTSQLGFIHSLNSKSARDLLIDKPVLKTNIPFALLTLNRKQHDAGIKVVSAGSSGIDESRLDLSRARKILSIFYKQKSDSAVKEEKSEAGAKPFCPRLKINLF